MDLREKITIGVCSPGQWHAMFATSLIDIARSQSQLGQLISLEGSGVISRLRNQVVATFLEKTTDDWLLQIDTDQIITVENFKKLVAAADKDVAIKTPLSPLFSLGTNTHLHSIRHQSVSEPDFSATLHNHSRMR